MSVATGSLKRKAAHEAREFFLIFVYLFLVLSLFVVYKSVVLAQYRIPFALHGFALINALALAKIMLVADELHLADRFRDAPLIYPTVLKAFAFTVVLTLFKVAEDAALGWFHGKSFHESLADLGGGSWRALFTLSGLLFVVLIPFCGFTELRRAFGEERLLGAFFRSRHLLHAPPGSSETAPPISGSDGNPRCLPGF
jgi:hypothetical protein